MAGDEHWVEIARIGDVAENDVIEVTVGALCLALFHLDGRYFVTAGICTHAHARLAEGYIQDGTIECPLHQGLFDIQTGRAVGAPVSRDLQTFAVRVDGDAILARLPA